MANITNEQAIGFCNKKARALANYIETTRRTAEQFALDIVVEFEANVQGNAGGDVITSDERGVLTKDQVLGLKFVAEQMVIALTQDDREELVARVRTSGQPLF